MPHYEFICQDCHKGFLKTVSQQDYEEGKLTCPHCGSHAVELRVTLPVPARRRLLDAVTSRGNEDKWLTAS